MKKIDTGQIFRVKDGEEFFFLQYLGKHPLYGETIRVFPDLISDDSEIDGSSLEEQDSYVTFYPLSLSARDRMVSPASLRLSNYPEIPLYLRRPGARSKNGEILSWILEDSNGDTPRTQLSEEEKSLPIAGIWNHEYLLHRVRQGWHPRQEGS